MAIRHEIQRFESVHPSIYAIYDLIELVPDPLLAQQIREHVVCIEGRTRPLFTRVARWYIFKPKIQIWVNFEGSCNGRCWHFYVHLVYFKAILYIYGHCFF
jgi:Arf-GAP/GTPase/ANK repeat/PH domain-containing protein 1/3